MSHIEDLNDLIEMGNDEHHVPSARMFAVACSIAKSLAAIADVVEEYEDKPEPVFSDAFLQLWTRRGDDDDRTV